MKIKLFFFFSLTCCFMFSQTVIQGKVITQNNKPLKQASVYLNNTSYGTATDENGVFTFAVKPGIYTLVTSYVGYETYNQTINTDSIPKEIIITLYEKATSLSVVVLKNKKKKKISRKRRIKYLKKFKENFLGKTSLADQCVIKNEYVLEFDYDITEDKLEVYSTNPLVIENYGLGYKIIYDLIEFNLNPRGVSYLGYLKYEELEATEEKQKEWTLKREKAYYGSFRHFIQSVLNQQELSGFLVDEIELKPNPERPSNKEIAKAVKLLTTRSGLQKNPFDKNIGRELQVDKAKEIVQKAKMKRFTENIKKRNLDVKEFLNTDNSPYLYSKNLLQVRYMREFEEEKYPSLYAGKNYQVSKISFVDKKAMLNPIGILENPLDIVLEGYWAFEKVADKLPLEYDPKK